MSRAPNQPAHRVIMGRDGLHDRMKLLTASKHFFFSSSLPCAQLVWLSADLSRLWRCGRVLGRVVVSDDTRIRGRVMWKTECQSGDQVVWRSVTRPSGWVAWSVVTRPGGRVIGKNGLNVTQPGGWVCCWSYSTWWSSVLLELLELVVEYVFWFRLSSSNLLANSSKPPKNNSEMQYACKAILIMKSMQEWWGMI